ncbi:MAG: hypothetical protein Q9186_004667, partial [Xanthomendoza sp. 1 TL-2023]
MAAASVFSYSCSFQSCCYQPIEDQPKLSPRDVVPVFDDQVHTASHRFIEAVSKDPSRISLRGSSPVFNAQDQNSSRIPPLHSFRNLHTKRTLPGKYHDLICRGGALWDAIQRTFQGHQDFTPPAFGEKPFLDSGWVLDSNIPSMDIGLSGGWEKPLMLFPDGNPRPEETWEVTMDQADQYTSEQGRPYMVSTSSD